MQSQFIGSQVITGYLTECRKFKNSKISKKRQILAIELQYLTGICYHFHDFILPQK
jgi:hypothetical protein